MTTEVPQNLSPRQRAFLLEVRTLADELPNKGFGELYYTSVDRKLRFGDDSYFKFMAQLERTPVDIEEFLDGEDYLGATDLEIWPEVRQTIIDINRYWWKNGHGAYDQVVLMGATSTAKSTIATITTLYSLYLLSCLKNPQNIY